MENKTSKFECPFGYKDKHENCSHNGMIPDNNYSISSISPEPTRMYRCAHMGSFKCKLDSHMSGFLE